MTLQTLDFPLFLICAQTPPERPLAVQKFKINEQTHIHLFRSKQSAEEYMEKKNQSLSIFEISDIDTLANIIQSQGVDSPKCFAIEKPITVDKTGLNFESHPVSDFLK